MVRVTASPNGDGVNDHVAIGLRGTPNATVRLVDVASRIVVATAALDGDGSGEAIYAPDAARGSWQLLRACEDGGACAGPTIHVALRSVRIAVLTLRGVHPGDRLRIAVRADGPVRVSFEEYGVERPRAVAPQDVDPGVSTVDVPDVRSGVWLVVAVTARGERAVAPIVVRAAAGAAPAVALVVVPTLTMRAYDRGDWDRDGRIDTWYAGRRADGVPALAPFEPKADGQPWHGARRMLAGLRFLRSSGAPIDVVSDLDLPELGPAGVRAYRVIAFPGHEEYYTDAMYRVVERYRDDGGRLWFMQANSFYTEVAIRRGRMRITGFAVRTPTRSDYALAGGGYVACCWAPARPAFRLTRAAREKVPWLLAGTSLRPGDVFGYALGEADAVHRRLSPPETVRIATASLPAGPNSRRGARADVSYYAGPNGSEVLDLGTVAAFEQLLSPVVPSAVKRVYSRMMGNAWRHLLRP